MSNSDQLRIDFREHDLPPRWDGDRVEWSEWTALTEGNICPPPMSSERCEQCRSTAAPMSSRGTVITDYGPNVVPIGRAQRSRKLVVFRCADCQHDTVWEIDTGQHWGLDPSDYTSAGSWSIG